MNTFTDTPSPTKCCTTLKIGKLRDDDGDDNDEKKLRPSLLETR